MSIRMMEIQYVTQNESTFTLYGFNKAVFHLSNRLR